MLLSLYGNKIIMDQLLNNLKVQINEKIYLKDPESSDLGKRIISNSIQMIHASSSVGISIVDIYESAYWSKRIAGFGTFIED